MQGAEPSTSASASATRRRSVSPALPCVLLDKDGFILLCDVRVRAIVDRAKAGAPLSLHRNQSPEHAEQTSCRNDPGHKASKVGHLDKGQAGWALSKIAAPLRRALAPVRQRAVQFPPAALGWAHTTRQRIAQSLPALQAARNRHAARASRWSQDMCPLARNGPLARPHAKKRTADSPRSHSPAVAVAAAACGLRSARCAAG